MILSLGALSSEACDGVAGRQIRTTGSPARALSSNGAISWPQRHLARRVLGGCHDPSPKSPASPSARPPLLLRKILLVLGQAALCASLTSSPAGAEPTRFVTVDGQRYPVGAPPSVSPGGSSFGQDELGGRPQPAQPALLPASVDLSQQQTPVKNQLGRDTCGTFATVAALEAAYLRRYSLTLDLSEQYLNHMAQSMTGIAADAQRDLPLAETWPGVIGGGGIGRPLGAMAIGIGVPLDTDLPYIGDTGYQEAQAGDRPLFSAQTTQRAMDDFNFASVSQSYIFVPPTVTTTTVMPQVALAGARYRASSVLVAGTEQTSLAWYRTQLAAGREVIIEFNCCDGIEGANGGGVWTPPPGSNGGSAGHAMLIVGYDDARKAFRVKNSWGRGFGDQGYAWISYDFATRGIIHYAATITGIVPPSTVFDASANKQLFLGNWNFDFDGWKARLDIYNLPSNETALPPQGRMLRLGTLFLEDGRSFRVNGSITGNKLEFWQDAQDPNQARWPLKGQRYTLYMFFKDNAWMAGTLTSLDNDNFSLQAGKGPLPTGRANPGPLKPESYFGTWDVNFDGTRGRMEFSGAARVPLPGGLTLLAGRYFDPTGTSVASLLLIESDARRFAMTLALPTPVTLKGYVNGHEKGVLSATTVQAATVRGLVATRR